MQSIPWDYALILSVLTIVVPWRGTVRIRELLAHPTLGTSERVAMYGSTIAFQWLGAILTAWRGLARGGGEGRGGCGPPPAFPCRSPSQHSYWESAFRFCWSAHKSRACTASAGCPPISGGASMKWLPSSCRKRALNC